MNKVQRGGEEMLFKVLKRLVETQGLTEELREKIDIFYAASRLTAAEYNQLIEMGTASD